MPTAVSKQAEAKASAPRLRGALDELERQVMEGLRHGFFDYSITCQIVNGGKRQLVLRAGKSHQFTIPQEEVPH